MPLDLVLIVVGVNLDELGPVACEQMFVVVGN
jgi:hypothetical protein